MTSEFFKAQCQEEHFGLLKILSESFEMLWSYEVEHIRIRSSSLHLWLAPQMRFTKVCQHQAVIMTGVLLQC